MTPRPTPAEIKQAADEIRSHSIDLHAPVAALLAELDALTAQLAKATDALGKACDIHDRTAAAARMATDALAESMAQSERLLARIDALTAEREAERAAAAAFLATQLLCEFCGAISTGWLHDAECDETPCCDSCHDKRPPHEDERFTDHPDAAPLRAYLALRGRR